MRAMCLGQPVLEYYDPKSVGNYAAILSRGDVIQAEHLAFASRGATPQRASRAPAPEIAEAAHAEPPAGPRDLDEKLEDIERTELMLALARAGGNKAEMARQLGMQRTTLYYRLKKLGIET